MTRADELRAMADELDADEALKNTILPGDEPPVKPKPKVGLQGQINTLLAECEQIRRTPHKYKNYGRERMTEIARELAVLEAQE